MHTTLIIALSQQLFDRLRQFLQRNYASADPILLPSSSPAPLLTHRYRLEPRPPRLRQAMPSLAATCACHVHPWLAAASLVLERRDL